MTVCFIFSVGRRWWYPTMSFKIAQSNLNSDGALPLCIPILLGWPAYSSLIHPQGRSCVKLPLPTCFQVLHHSSHGLGRSPYLSSYFLIQYPRCGSQLWSCWHMPHFFCLSIWSLVQMRFLEILLAPVNCFEFVFCSCSKHIRSIQVQSPCSTVLEPHVPNSWTTFKAPSATTSTISITLRKRCSDKEEITHNTKLMSSGKD